MPDVDADVPTFPWGGMEEVAVSPDAITDILRSGADKAREVIVPVLDRARANIGLTPA